MRTNAFIKGTSEEALVGKNSEKERLDPSLRYSKESRSCAELVRYAMSRGALKVEYRWVETQGGNRRRVAFVYTKTKKPEV